MTKYLRLAEQLRVQIQSGALRPGDRLPSFAEMRTQFGASPLTVDRVYSTLESDGLVVREQGRGTFVAPPRREVALESGRLIGLVVPGCTGHFFSRLMHGVEEEAQAQGYHVMIANSGGDSEKEAPLLASVAAQTMGLCVFPCEPENYVAYARLLQDKVPFVFVDHGIKNLHVPLVATDNVQGGYLATRHLLEMGRRHIWVLTEGGWTSGRDRVRGYRRALQEAGVPFDPALVRNGPLALEAAGYTLTKEVLQEVLQAGHAPEPFGIFALNDCIARGAYMALKEAGLKIPQDVAVIGFDDADAAFLDPPLSSVRQDLEGMGRGAVRLLLEVLRRGAARDRARAVLLEPQLIVRNSSDLHSDFCAVRHILDAAATPGSSPNPPALAGQ